MTDNGGGDGGGGGEDLRIPPDITKQLVGGIKAAISELEEIGAAITESNRGAGFENLTLTSKEAGTGGVASDFESFCEHWEWGVRACMSDANTLAEELDWAVGLEHMSDYYWSSTFKHGLNAINLMSNPGLSRHEVAQQDWGDIATPDVPDWSKDSMDRALQQVQHSWGNPDGSKDTFQPAGGDETHGGGNEGGRR